MEGHPFRSPTLFSSWFLQCALSGAISGSAPAAPALSDSIGRKGRCQNPKNPLELPIPRVRRSFPSAVKCFVDDFEACIAHLRFPISQRRVIRTTNLLERLFGEERRRMKIVPNAFGERAVLKLTYAALIRASEGWRGIQVKPFETKQLRVIGDELDTEYQRRNEVPKVKPTGSSPSRESGKT